MNIEAELNSLEKTIARSNSELSKAQGSVETLEKRLKQEENISSIQEAKEVIEVLEKDIDFLETNITTKIKDLKTIYEW